MVDSFLSYLKNEKRLSIHTYKAYEKDLSQFQDYYQANFDGSIEKADFRSVRSWLVSLNVSKLSNTTVNRKIATLRSFYSFLLRKEKIEINPMLRIKPMKKPQSPPVFIDNTETVKLFDEIEFASDFEGKRDQMVLEMLYGTGIRLAELLTLEINDIDLFGSKITVTGKRNKQRVIPIGASLRQQITSYLSKRQEVAEPEIQSFILTNKGQKAYPVMIQRLVKKYLSKVSTRKKKSPHVLRHTFATHLLNKGADLNAIKELLGHSSLSSTQIYTHSSIEQLKAIHSQSHPKAE
ncbi:tyrosine-type recombinase/integrase [Jiulongibacter sp. NS-SX5]|uniref:tyrosine-type recombinase/integrase n=1 Tax=Jiulongibacter sp. NS-SX5 TaxID=3463854 RepID=UPI0040588D53